MQAATNTERARSLYQAFIDKDRAVAEALLSDDFSFTSPYDDHIGRTAYFERCWPNSDRIEAIRIERTAEAEDAVFVLYTCATVAGARFRNMEYLRFDDGKLKSVEVYFGELPA
jgi:ketosteroid isomerase-like protein